MSRTAVGGAGFGDDWLPFVAAILAAEILPKKWARLVASGAAAYWVYRWWREQGGKL